LFLRQTGQVQGARTIAGQEQLGHVKPYLCKRPRPTKERAQLKVRKYLLDASDGFAVRRIELEPVDAQAQDEGIDGDLLEPQFGVQVLVYGINRSVLDQPWCKEKTK
jgi:hypothetical protein